MKLARVLLAASAFVLAASGAGTDASIKGWVIDSACTFTKQLEKPISPQCAIACAKKGSPLVVLGDDGKIYYPISDQTPAAGQNAKLMPFAGKRASISGKVYERSGAHAIVIEKIEAEK